MASVAQPRLELSLHPDEDDREWLLERGKDTVGRLRLEMSGADLELDGRTLGLGPSDRRTIALWDDATGAPLAWLARSRRPARRAAVLLPGDEEDDLELVQRPLRGPCVRSADGQILATVSATPLRDERPHVRVTVSATADVDPARESALWLVAIAILLEEMRWEPKENRAGGDAGWERRDGAFDGLFGDGDGGGGGGDGGGGGG